MHKSPKILQLDFADGQAGAGAGAGARAVANKQRQKQVGVGQELGLWQDVQLFRKWVGMTDAAKSVARQMGELLRVVMSKLGG